MRTKNVSRAEFVWLRRRVEICRVEGDVLVVVDQIAHDYLWPFVDAQSGRGDLMNEEDFDMESVTVMRMRKVLTREFTVLWHEFGESGTLVRLPKMWGQPHRYLFAIRNQSVMRHLAALLLTRIREISATN
jgi:hypothetical protein